MTTTTTVDELGQDLARGDRFSGPSGPSGPSGTSARTGTPNASDPGAGPAAPAKETHYGRRRDDQRPDI
jgi:hypothetical protein